MNATVMIYVQHLLGIGHQRRAACIARALCDQGAAVWYVSGGMPVPGLDIGCAHLLQLPPARAEDASYARLLDAEGRGIGHAWRTRRKQRLLRAFADAQPDVLLLESFPFGRRMFRFELLALLDAARARTPRPLVVSSVRDILEPKRKPGRNAEIVGWVQAYFDRVLVHADARYAALGDSFALADQIRAQTRYTGYVVEQPPPGSARMSGVCREVLVSAGGGLVGGMLLRAAIGARRHARLATGTWRCLVGPNLGNASFRALRRKAGEGVIVERNRADFPLLLANCAVSVSQAGYNTVFEALAAGARMVVCPFTEAQETEQSTRARLLAVKGLAEVIPDARITSCGLAEGVDRAFARGRISPGQIDTGGAARTARLVLGSRRFATRI